MKQLSDRFLDERLRWPDGVCVHCGIDLNKATKTREHIPSKCFLTDPYPDQLMTMEACRECNLKFSFDEEYMSMLLAAVLAGSTDPDKQTSLRLKRKFGMQPALRERIRQSQTTENVFGVTTTTFVPEQERVKNVLIKNARGHSLYELDRWMNWQPDYANALPMVSLTPEQYDAFKGVPRGVHLAPWSEIGTRMFMRECYSLDPNYQEIDGGWILVQDQNYRFRVDAVGEGVSVQSVIHEYLATEVYWSDENAD